MMGETYCNEAGILQIIYLIKLSLSIARIVIPIILIIMVMIDVLKLVVSKDLEIGKTIKKIVRRLLAAVLVFLIPTILNVVLNILGSTTTIEFSSCWVNATKENVEMLKEKEREQAEKEENDRKSALSQNTKKKDELAKELRKNMNFHTSTSNDDFEGVSLNANAQSGSCLPSAYKEGKFGEAIVKTARSYVGKTPYVFGGTSLTAGADCSGFTQAIYGLHGVSITRTTYTQINDGAPINSLAEARAGDLLIFDGHVGIYNGAGGMIHASTERVGTIESSINSGPIIGIRRIVC